MKELAFLFIHFFYEHRSRSLSHFWKQFLSWIWSISLWYISFSVVNCFELMRQLRLTHAGTAEERLWKCSANVLQKTRSLNLFTWQLRLLKITDWSKAHWASRLFKNSPWRQKFQSLSFAVHISDDFLQVNSVASYFEEEMDAETAEVLRNNCTLRKLELVTI